MNFNYSIFKIYFCLLQPFTAASFFQTQELDSIFQSDYTGEMSDKHRIKGALIRIPLREKNSNKAKYLINKTARSCERNRAFARVNSAPAVRVERKKLSLRIITSKV